MPGYYDLLARTGKKSAALVFRFPALLLLPVLILTIVEFTHLSWPQRTQTTANTVTDTAPLPVLNVDLFPLADRAILARLHWHEKNIPVNKLIVSALPVSDISLRFSGYLIADNRDKSLVIVQEGQQQTTLFVGDPLPDRSAVIIDIQSGGIIINRGGYYESILFESDEVNQAVRTNSP